MKRNNDLPSFDRIRHPLRAMIRKPSCLTSCSYRLPEGSVSAFG